MISKSTVSREEHTKLFEQYKEERVKRKHYQDECVILREELQTVRAAYANLEKKKEDKVK